MGCIAVHRLLARPLWCCISCAPWWTASTSHLAHHSGRCRSLPGLHLPTLSVLPVVIVYSARLTFLANNYIPE
ncbi:hypothetical protein B0H11DRAFT_2012474 [Mycena galericulata]|nr:hypothetical protein B0H11DRAFT_2012474 [Mycena galericulata]